MRGAAAGGALDPSLPQKKRARHRLIGAIVLSSVAVLLLPQVFESEPVRPMSEALLVVSPPQPGLQREAPPVPSAAASPAADPVGPAAASASAQASASTPASAAPQAARPVSPSAATPPPAASPAAAPGQSPAAAPGQSPAAASGQSTAAPAQSPTAPAAPATGRFLVQVGAFATDWGARQAVDRAQAQGLVAFTERIKTEHGDRIRVRVGPFASREAAERARDRLRTAGMEAALVAP
jgi:DedD protein